MRESEANWSVHTGGGLIASATRTRLLSLLGDTKGRRWPNKKHGGGITQRGGYVDNRAKRQIINK